MTLNLQKVNVDVLTNAYGAGMIIEVFAGGQRLIAGDIPAEGTPDTRWDTSPPTWHDDVWNALVGGEEIHLR